MKIYSNNAEIFRHALIEIGDKDRSEILICLRLPQINQGLPAHARRRDNERNGWKTGRKTEPRHAPPSFINLAQLSNKGRSCYKISYQASQADKYNFLWGCHHFLFGFILLQCCFFLVRTPTHLLLEASEGGNLSFLLLLVSPIRIPILFPCEHHHAQTT